jgi:hypothetical protein
MKEKDGMMISCKRATELVEIQFEKKLSFKQQFQLKLHLILCKVCDIYANQSQKLNQILAQVVKQKVNKTSKEDSQQLKGKIIKKLEEIES